MKRPGEVVSGLVVLMVILILASCEAAVWPISPASGYSYQTPEQVDDGWETASLSDVGIRAGPLVQLMDDLLRREDHYYHSILIVKDGKLVFEEYFSGEDVDFSRYDFARAAPVDFDRDTTHCQASVTKSVTSILVGIAIDKGFIQGVDERLISFFPEYADLSDRYKDQITIAHMLAMATGIPWDESYPYADPRNDLNRMWHHREPVRAVLEMAVVAEPGTTFLYNSGTTNLLGEIVRRTSGLSLVDFAEQYLFAPLGITSYQWVGFEHDPEMAFASSGLYLRPRDMAKIGQLVLQEGVWNGRQVVSSEWIKASVEESAPISTQMRQWFHTSGYGYLWWLEEYPSGSIEAYSARGHGLQFIVVLPKVNMVVVFTGGAWGIAPADTPIHYDDIIEGTILPAVIK